MPLKKRSHRLFFLLLLCLNCSCTHWGYNGPLYDWTKEDIVYFDMAQNKITFKDSSKIVISVSVLFGKGRPIEYKDILLRSNSYTLPDSILPKLTNNKFKIIVSPQNLTNYTIKIRSGYWGNRKYVYGIPLNDVSNYQEMHNEIYKLNKQSN